MSPQAQEPANGGYSDVEMIKMQRDAIRRVREMQNRARNFEQARRAVSEERTAREVRQVTGEIAAGQQAVQQGTPIVPIPRPTPGGNRPGGANPNHQGSQGGGGGGGGGLGGLLSGGLGNLFGGGQGSSGGGLGSLTGGLGSLLGGQGISGLGNTINETINNVSQPVAQALEALGLDNERLLIIMVMFLVFMQEDSDKMLLLALGYLLF